MTQKRQVSHAISGELEGMERLESTITVYEKAEIPDPLKQSVEGILLDTLGHLLDGKEISWWIDENDNYVMSLVGGFPEIPSMNGPWLPPYRAREKFEGIDGQETGLYHDLHGNWGYECKNESSYIFFPDK